MDRLMRRALITGFLGGIAGVHVSLVGMVDTFQGRDTIADVVTLGSMLPILILLLVGWRAASPIRTTELKPSAGRSLLLGAIACAVTGFILATLAILVEVVNLRWILVNATPGLAEILQFEQGQVVGSLILIVGGAALGTVGASMHILPSAVARALALGFLLSVGTALMEPFLGPVLRNLELDAIEDIFFAGGGLTPIGFILVFAATAADVTHVVVDGRVVVREGDRDQVGRMLDEAIGRLFGEAR